MTTNKEWLNSLESDELKAWLNADRDTPIKEVSERANLEADIINWLGSWTAFSVPTSEVKQFMLACLNRQAAITKREQQAQIDKLTADLLASNQEREHWREVCSELIGKTHEMQSLYDEGLA